MSLISPSANDFVRKEKLYFSPNRPWMSLYGKHVRPVSSPACIAKTQDPSLINSMLPDELFQEVLLRLDPTTLGKASCVCRRWRNNIRAPVLWRRVCLKAWQTTCEVDNEKFVWNYFQGSWRKMFKLRPRVRTDGLYVSRNTYIRVGIVEWRTKNPVHMVCYFRYLRFLPSGKFYYKVSPLFVKDVARFMISRPSKNDGVLVGRYSLNDDIIDSAILYPGTTPTVLRIRGRLRGTCIGANNRIDLLLLVTCGIGEEDIPDNSEDVLEACESWNDDESHNPDLPAVKHKRGMAPFVFVPFDQVDTDILNLPIDKMDFYLPG